MNKELIGAIEALEKENGISKELLFDAIERALLEEYKEQYATTDNVEIALDRVTGDFHIYSLQNVVEDDAVELPSDIGITEAKKLKSGIQVGGVIKTEIKSDSFSRTAAKKAKSTIVQTIREAEKSAVYNEYHSKEKEIITGIVQRIDDKGNVHLDIGRTQTVLKVVDQVEGERLERGQRVKLFVASVSNDKKPGSFIRVSRNSPMLVERLFEEEVTEIKDGIVEIMGIAREAGSRTKMAVKAKDPNVDPVGACVGINGSRVRAVVNELGNEQIDIIEWDENPAQFIANALSPAKVVSIKADDDERKAKIIVTEGQLSLAIGKSGQNVRLAARLTGYGIDIKSEENADDDSFDESEEFSISEDGDFQGEETSQE